MALCENTRVQSHETSQEQPKQDLLQNLLLIRTITCWQLHVLDEHLHSVLAEVLIHFPCHHHCDHGARQKREHDSKYLNKITNLVEKLLWSHSQKKFRKYNFHNDQVITKITKIFYYENLELYSMQSLVTMQLIRMYACNCVGYRDSI